MKKNAKQLINIFYSDYMLKWYLEYTGLTKMVISPFYFLKCSY